MAGILIAIPFLAKPTGSTDTGPDGKLSDLTWIRGFSGSARLDSASNLKTGAGAYPPGQGRRQ
jgi:hypothetical protein